MTELLVALVALAAAVAVAALYGRHDGELL